MARLAPQAIFQPLDDEGNIIPGGLLYTYAAGTSTPLATYTDETEATANANPIVLDAAGRADVWLGSDAYKFALHSAADVEIWTVDSITAAESAAFGSTVVSTTSNYNVTELNAGNVIVGSNTITLSLLAASDAEEGFFVIVKNEGAGTLTVDPSGADTIDGLTTLIIEAGKSAIVISDGVEWYKLLDVPIQAFGKVETITANEAVTVADNGKYYLMDNSTSVDLNLPAGSTIPAGFTVFAKGIGTSNFVLDANGADTIDGVSARGIIIGDSVAVVWSGTEWHTNFRLGAVSALALTWTAAQTFEATVDFNDNAVEGVGTPVETTDAANKAYVDATAAAVGWDALTPVVASAASSVDITGLAGYHEIEISATLSTSTSLGIAIQTSTDNGSSFDSAGSDYSWQYNGSSSATDAADSDMNIEPTSVNSARVINIKISSLDDANSVTYVQAVSTHTSPRNMYGAMGMRIAQEAVNAIRISATAGNITGTLYIRGLKNAS